MTAMQTGEAYFAAEVRRGGWGRRRILATLIIGLFNGGWNQVARAEDIQQAETQFDPHVLKSLGIEPSVADFFKYAPRFAPGSHSVTLNVNGARKGLIDASFDATGNLCFTRGLLYQAGLAIPKDLPLRDAAPYASAAAPASSEEPKGGGADATRRADALECYDYARIYPQTVVSLHPGSNAIDIVVPTDALAAPALTVGDYKTGGTAALFNYNVIGTSMRNEGASSQYWQADTEVGFNVSDWVLRSRQVVSSTNGRTSWNHEYAYAQHTLFDEKAVFQAGQINVANSLFSIGSVYGVQFFPESSLITLDQPGGARIDGIAQTQARVEIRQLGALLYSTLVPAGPFTLTGFRLLNTTSDLNVTVFEANGGQHSFIVPAATFNAGSTLGQAQGLSIAAGKLQGSTNTSVAPWFVTVSNGWRMGTRANLSLGLLFTSPYQAMAAGADMAPIWGVTGSFNMLASNSRSEGENARGVRGTLSLATAWASPVNFNASVTRQSSGYRDLSDITNVPQSFPLSSQNGPWQPWLIGRTRAEYSAGTSWNSNGLGGFSLSYTRSELFDGTAVQRVIGAWSKSFKYATVSLNLEHDVGSGTNSGNSLYLSATIPLGRRSVRTYFNNTDGTSRAGVSMNDTVDSSLSYSLSADRSGSNDSSLSASANVLSRYTQLGLNASASQQRSTMLSAQLSGGVVAYPHGVALSTYSVSDTFGIAKLNDVSGVQLNTTAGPVWTDSSGTAVIPSISPYSPSRLSIDTKSLPRNVDIQNGMKVLDVGHGSVSNVEFDAIKVRRLLLAATLPDGAPVPLASSVVDADNQYVTTVGDDGAIFLTNDKFKAPLEVLMSAREICYLNYTPPAKQDLDRFYDAVNATCDKHPAGK